MQALPARVQIFEQYFGPKHPETASAINNLGVSLENLGNLVGARDRFQQALSIDQKALGPYHPNVARDAGNLGGA